MERAFDNLTLWQRVYDHLRDEIRQQRLLPGTVLSEVALSEELGVSRGPIREAMGRLASEGLVTIRPRRGAVVRSLTAEELVDAYQVREALESMAVRLAVPRLTKPDLALLEAHVDQMDAHSDGGDLRLFFEANVAFHNLFCELSGNRKLHQVHTTLMGEIGGFQDRTVSLRGNPSRSVTEHRRILAAARRRDADKAAELAAAHVRVPSERLRLHLSERAGLEPVAVAADGDEPVRSTPGERAS
ncbi:MAG: GntR family transcriptional regulator [Actinomycetota bacterium]|nr:GntR family transcriptional regulator [Actinomycetota bacterium]